VFGGMGRRDGLGGAIAASRTGLRCRGWVAGIAVNTAASGWSGAKASLLGAGPGIAHPAFVLTGVLGRRGLEADWRDRRVSGSSAASGSAWSVHAGCGGWRWF
jgi:hypothetical protein